MCAVAEKPKLSPEDLLVLPDEKNYELIDGELAERNASYYSSLVGSRINRRLGGFVEDHDLGWVAAADAGFQCFPDSPRTVRRPDVSFIRKDRLPDGPPFQGWMTIAPDLAVEVISPNDLAYEVDEKVMEYRGVGIPLIWVVNPLTRTILVHRSDGPITPPERRR